MEILKLKRKKERSKFKKIVLQILKIKIWESRKNGFIINCNNFDYDNNFKFEYFKEK